MRWRLLTLPALGLVLLTIKSNATVNMSEAITAAARAPYVALARRDARALCSDFVPAASRQLARNVSHLASCQARVAEAFAVSAPFEPPSRVGLLRDVKVGGISWHGNRARANVSYGKAGQSSEGVRIALGKISGRWLVSTQPRLALIKACLVHRRLSQHCPKEALVLLFVIGSPTVNTGIKENLVPVPEAVERAGGQELQEFKAGMKVAVQSGCLACHRIGDNGNAGPGRDLTHIGSILSETQIEHAILDPSAPMPSFKGLSREKLAAVIEFLSQLK
jgi:hypothetical protein